MKNSRLVMGFIAAFMLTGLTTALCSYASHYLDRSSLIMIYLLSIVYIATRFGRGPSILASLLAIAEFCCFCTPGHLSLAVSDTQYIITLTVMLTITILITTLTSEVQAQAALGKIREKRSEALRDLSTEMSLLRGRDRLVTAALRHVRTFFDSQVGIYLPDAKGRLGEYTAAPKLARVERPLNERALWTFQNEQKCGLGIEPFPAEASLYLPLIASESTVGVLQISPQVTARMTLAEDLELLETFAGHIALCIEVAILSERNQAATIQVEREQLRNVLLSSVSHDLCTPLATITGASSSLVEDRHSLTESQKQELAQVILEEAEHLNSHVRNLLEMTRLESGLLTVKTKWHSIEETVGACLTRLEHQLNERQVHIQIPANLPLVPFDEMLIQQVFLNLLENAVKYTPPESAIDIDAHVEPPEQEDSPGYIAISVSDRGPGLKPGEEEKIFIKFYRSSATPQHLGVGLGLAICQAIIKAHGGTIRAGNREGGGAEFCFRLPLSGEPPASIVEPVQDEADVEKGNNKKAPSDTPAEQTAKPGEQV